MSELKMRCRTCPMVMPAMKLISDLQFKLRYSMDSANLAQKKSRRLLKLIKFQRETLDECHEQIRLLTIELAQRDSAKNPVPSAVRGLDL